MSTRNPIEKFKEIPIKSFNHHYFMDDNCTILFIPNIEEVKPEKIYIWNEKTSLKPMKFHNYELNKDIYIDPISLYMMTNYSFTKSKIIPGSIPELCRYEIDPDAKITFNFKEVSINGEIFKVFPQDPRYYINEYGCVLDVSTAKFVRQRNKYSEYNYKTVHNYAVHRMVYTAWYGDIPIGRDIHHKDGNDWNNHYTNLIALTRKEHEQSHGCQLTPPKVVHEICRRLSNGEHMYAIARAVGVIPDTVKRIYQRKSYTEISCGYEFPEISRDLVNRKLTEDQIKEICKLFQERKLNNKQIGSIYGVNQYTIQDLRKRKSYREITSEYQFDSNDVGINTNLSARKSRRNASIDEEKVIAIWRELQKGKISRVIAEELGVTKTIVDKIRQRYRWTSVTDKLGPLPGDKNK